MSDSKLRLTVVLTTYNGAKYLPTQLQSLLDQSRRPDEMIVSDDRSTDGTLELMRAFAERAPFPVRVVQQPTNLGANPNFGKALEMASGDVLLPCDQDDLWHADKLSKIAAVFEDDDAVALTMNDATVSDGSLMPLDRTLWQELGFTSEKQDALESGAAVELFAKGLPIFGCTAAVRSSVAKYFLPLPPELAFDAWMGAVAAALGPVRLIREPLQLYRQHASQVVGLDRGTRLGKILRICGRSDVDAVEREATALEVQLRQLEQMPATPGRLRTEALFKDRLRLTRLRVTARRSLLRRLPLIARCLADGSYSRAARGWSSAAVDLLARPQKVF